MQSMTLNASAKRMAQSLNNKPFYGKIFTCIWVLQGAKQDDYLTEPNSIHIWLFIGVKRVRFFFILLHGDRCEYLYFLKGVVPMTVLNELDSTCGISDDELTQRFKEAIRIDKEVRKIKGLPVAKYDDETKRAYLEYPDGRREYVGE